MLTLGWFVIDKTEMVSEIRLILRACRTGFTLQYERKPKAERI